jgi:hypothetical protein
VLWKSTSLRAMWLLLCVGLLAGYWEAGRQRGTIRLVVVTGGFEHSTPPQRGRWVLTFGALGEVDARPLLPMTPLQSTSGGGAAVK